MNVYIIKAIEPKKKEERISLRQNIRCLPNRATRSVMNCTALFINVISVSPENRGIVQDDYLSSIDTI